MLNRIQILTKPNQMQIGAQGIKNTVVTSIIHGYGVGKKKNSTQKKERSKPFHSIQTKFPNQNLFP
jgi:hypothetical protein